ncbi:MAG: hypothetical protein MJD61_13750 [Proteobacteria bacterium]|nr:hypothetical protein [Pseudomonadota bacterium]
MDREWSFFALKWKPKSWNRRYRLLCLRRRVRCQRKGPLQLDLFEPRSFQLALGVLGGPLVRAAGAILQSDPAVSGAKAVQLAELILASETHQDRQTRVDRA